MTLNKLVVNMTWLVLNHIKPNRINQRVGESLTVIFSLFLHVSHCPWNNAPASIVQKFAWHKSFYEWLFSEVWRRFKGIVKLNFCIFCWHYLVYGFCNTFDLFLCRTSEIGSVFVIFWITNCWSMRLIDQGDRHYK
jgi:hypothetical protein